MPKAKREPRYLEASRKQKRDMCGKIARILRKAGFKNAFEVKGSFFPSIQIDVPRDRDLVSYSISID